MTLRKRLPQGLSGISLIRAERGGIHKTDTDTSTRQDFLDESSNCNRASFFNSTIIGYTLGKEARQMLAGIFLIMLEASETFRMKQNQDDHDFCIAHAVRLVPALMILAFNHTFFCTLTNSLRKLSLYNIFL